MCSVGFIMQLWIHAINPSKPPKTALISFDMSQGTLVYFYPGPALAIVSFLLTLSQILFERVVRCAPGNSVEGEILLSFAQKVCAGICSFTDTHGGESFHCAGPQPATVPSSAHSQTVGEARLSHRNYLIDTAVKSSKAKTQGPPAVFKV